MMWGGAECMGGGGVYIGGCVDDVGDGGIVIKAGRGVIGCMGYDVMCVGNVIDWWYASYGDVVGG